MTVRKLSLLWEYSQVRDREVRKCAACNTNLIDTFVTDSPKLVSLRFFKSGKNVVIKPNFASVTEDNLA